MRPDEAPTPSSAKAAASGGSASERPAGTSVPESAKSARPASDSLAHGTKRVWWRTTGGKIAGVAGGIITTALALVISNLATGWLTHPHAASPASLRAGLESAAPKLTSSGVGWSLSPVVRSNGFLAVTASMEPQDTCDGATGWVFRQLPSRLQALPLAGDPVAWAVRNHGIPQSGNYISVTVQGLNGHTVVIESFGVKIISKQQAPTGTAAILSGGCGGLEPSFFKLNLDTPDAQIVPTFGSTATGETVQPVALPHVVSESNPEQWHLQIITTRYDCTFVPYFTWSSDGQQGTFYITNGSAPWEIASITRSQPAFRNAAGAWGTSEVG